MKSIIRFALCALVAWLGIYAAHAADPVVSNVRAAQRSGTRLVDITYDVAATGAVSVSVAVSTNSGVTYGLPASTQQHLLNTYGPKPQPPCSQNCYPLSI